MIFPPDTSPTGLETLSSETFECVGGTLRHGDTHD